MKLRYSVQRLKRSSEESPGFSVDPDQELEQAKNAGTWHALDSINQVDPDLEEQWRREKALKLEKERQTEVTANQAAWGCLGVAAFFFPVFWPIFLVQTFRAYPIASWFTLGIIVFLIIVLSSLH